MQSQNQFCKYNLGTRANKRKFSVRAGKYKFEVWTGKYKFGARLVNTNWGSGPVKRNWRLEPRGQAGGPGPGAGAGNCKDPMTSQTGEQILTRHILPNISRSKGNQTMKSTEENEMYSVNKI